ncbi:hypothetical protein GHNINEIG_01167 [Hydrogenovibrio crunogenus]|uniref:DUF4145 domain-containing protein n=1 Tax=Hydrogenovibrio crunogenus TaxID=39765 RepID=A0A4P7NZM3_9GAMM|nr:DUF4145 domain-containing protein [Hydrogenovibrio crunogenus]QBZ83126.1 hypothetical protein GHNINEIG_01167 [Hydrogenovibrio crunogenus]
MNTKKKAYCHKCRQDTNQTLLFAETEYDTREVFFEKLQGESRWVVEQRLWNLSKCLGCEMLNLEIETIHIGNSNTSKKQMPGKSRRVVPSWIFSLERPYIELLAEVYTAFNNGSFRLALMGVRAIFDIFMQEKVGDIGGFKKKLLELKKLHLINSTQVDLLDAAIDAGSATAHRGYNPSEEVMHSVMDIVEHLLKSISLENKLIEITSSTPKRE